MRGEGMIAQVVINSNVKQLNKKFDYIIPKELEDQVVVGATVLVPFGNSKTLKEAFVIDIKESSEFAVKEIAKVENNYLTEEKINLAHLMARRYFCNYADCIKLMMPPRNIKT